MIASTLTMTRDARARGYAVPAVNILDDLSLRAVIAAAVAARSPLIVQVSVKTVRSIGTDLMTTMFRSAADARRRADRAAPRPLPRPRGDQRRRPGRMVVGAVRRVRPVAAGRRARDRRGGRRGARRRASTSSPRSRTSSASRTASGPTSRCTPTTSRRWRPSRNAPASTCWPRSSGTAHGEYKAKPVLLPERVRELAALHRPPDRPARRDGPVPGGLPRPSSTPASPRSTSRPP